MRGKPGRYGIRILTYDCTLREGAQAKGISYSVEDKLRIAMRMDGFGLDYIEAGYPYSNPKEAELFERLRSVRLGKARISVFGSTRKVGARVEDDACLSAIVGSGMSVAAIVGKSWDSQVRKVLKATPEENLAMIADSVGYLAGEGFEVIFDAEHFFDGYASCADYALETVLAAERAGAAIVCLCDTNGGSFPQEVGEVTARVAGLLKAPIGIHCHNDNGMGAANTVASVMCGASMVQVTVNGIGERCGNADLCTVVPNLQLKLGYSCVPEGSMGTLTNLSRFVNEVSNVSNDERAPFVGEGAFAHKGGMHADAMRKDEGAYEHVAPDLVGNRRRKLISEVAGRSAILGNVWEVDPGVGRKSEAMAAVTERLKELEHEGYQYEGAEESFELVIRKVLGNYKPFFTLREFKVIVSEPSVSELNASAMIKVGVEGEEDEITAAEGEGPVNALDVALRKVLDRFYPEIRDMKLTDYKVRVIDSKLATAAKVRVLIETSDPTGSWNTVGVSTDIIEASWQALVDSIEYKLIKAEAMGKASGNGPDAGGAGQNIRSGVGR
ncbi:MAG: citramalate synthase [Oscillospiraceae bacterium]|nr:citramalate synthase [Oscillospiraceae bacterium]